jgi:hypothetical protein
VSTGTVGTPGKNHNRQGPAARTNKGHPRREDRRQRAAERAAAHVCVESCKRFRTGRVAWVPA